MEGMKLENKTNPLTEKLEAFRKREELIARLVEEKREAQREDTDVLNEPIVEDAMSHLVALERKDPSTGSMERFSVVYNKEGEPCVISKDGNERRIPAWDVMNFMAGGSSLGTYEFQPDFSYDEANFLPLSVEYTLTVGSGLRRREALSSETVFF